MKKSRGRTWQTILAARGKFRRPSPVSKKPPGLLKYWEKMFNSRVKIIFLLFLSGCLPSACAQVKEAGRTIGHTTRDVATAIGHGTRDAAKAVGEGVKKVVKPAPEDEW